ncbi:MAG: hypothetical protein IKB86_06765 [Clostridia bacterium]|nr:hypothetical protein [Clostridia bacterium]
MIKLYKDIAISYFLIAFTGAIVIELSLFDANVKLWTICLLMLLWLYICVTVFEKIAINRIKKILSSVSETCEVERGLNELFQIYKGRYNKRNDLIVAILICQLLLHLGKYTLVLSILQKYDVEALIKAKKLTIYKYLYYYVLAVSYCRLGFTEEAIVAYNKSDEIFNSANFNNKQRASYEQIHKINRSIIVGDGLNCTEIVAELEKALANSNTLITQVGCRNSIVTQLIRMGEKDKAAEHIAFIKERGGDTVYRKCALQNDFSNEFIKTVDNEPWEAKKQTAKHFKTLLCSVILTIIMIASTMFYGIATAKSIYVNDFNGSSTQSIQTFDENGQLLTWTMDSYEYYSSEMDFAVQSFIFSTYLPLNDYEGCEVTLKKEDNVIDFHLMVDFSKIDESAMDMFDFSFDEQEYVESIKKEQSSIKKYKRYFGGITVFCGDV